MKTLQKIGLLCSLMLFAALTTYAQTDSITVSGTLKGLGNNNFYLSIQNKEGKMENYRTKAVADHFSFQVPKLNYPAVARVNIGINRNLSATVNGQSIGNPAPYLDLFVYNKNIQIVGDAPLVHLASVTGDDENNVFNIYKTQSYTDRKIAYEVSRNFFQAKYNGEKLNGSADDLEEAGIAANKRNIQKEKDFIATHPDALASVFLLNLLSNQYNANEYTSVWNGLSAKYKDHQAAKLIRANIEKLSSTLAGKPAITFVKNDKDGKVIDLKAYKGRTVLLDFWGSWCLPCRASHPHLKTLYDKYKSKGFEIIAVAMEREKSLAESKARWLKAIAEDKINWVHVLNDDGVSSQNLVRDYKITGFPTKILIDKDGKIILRVTASATNDIDTELAKIYGF